jgi:uncharacterized repeat protein (TIGR01451 family)
MRMQPVRARFGRLPAHLAGVITVIGAVLVAGTGVAAAQSEPPAYALVPGSPFTTGSGSRAIAFSPDGEFIATANGGANTVSVFSVGADGVPTPIAGSPFTTNAPGKTNGQFPQSVAYSPSGQLLATANWSSNTISVFTVDGTTGALTPLPGSPFPAAAGHGNVTSVAFTPSGLSIAASQQNSFVALFQQISTGPWKQKAGASTNAPQPAEWVSVGYGGPTGTLLAVANNNTTGSVSTFAIDEMTPALDLVSGSPFDASARNTRGVAFDPSAQLLATANQGSDSTSLFADEASDGAQTLVGSPFAAGPSPYGAAFSADGQLLAVSNSGDDTVSIYSVSFSNGCAPSEPSCGGPQVQGDLLPVPGSPFSTRGSGTQAVGTQAVAFDTGGDLIATANGGTISMLSPTGGFEITKTAEAAQAPIGAPPDSVEPGVDELYTITVHNINQTDTTGQVTDDLTGVLDNASYQNDAQASSGTVSFDAATKQLVWSGALAGEGGQATITYSVKVNADANGVLSNSVTGPPGSNCAPAPELPCTTDTQIVQPPAAGPGADLSLSMTASSPTVHPGGQVTFALTARNNGPADAPHVFIIGPLPSGLSLQDAQSSQGSCTTAGELDCELGDLPSGAEALVSVTAIAATDASGSLLNQAWVDKEFDNPPEVNWSNNAAEASVDVVPLPAQPTEPGTQPVSDLKVNRPASEPIVEVGQDVTTTITVTNDGPSAASDARVLIGSKLPLSVRSIHPSRGSCKAGKPIRCSLGTLAKRGRATIRITARAKKTGRQRSAALVVSHSWDPATRNNLAVRGSRIVRAHRRARPRFTG